MCQGNYYHHVPWALTATVRNDETFCTVVDAVSCSLAAIVAFRAAGWSETIKMLAPAKHRRR
jgi:hypothetical protein